MEVQIRFPRDEVAVMDDLQENKCCLILNHLYLTESRNAVCIILHKRLRLAISLPLANN